MKKCLVSLASATLAVSAFWSIHGTGSGAVERESPSRATQIEKTARRWSECPQFELGSPELLRRFQELIDARSGLKDEPQRQKLLEFVKLWMDSLKAGTYESFLRFRKPDFCLHSSNCMGLLKAHVLKEWAEGLDFLPDEELSKMHFNAVIKWKFQSVPTNTILFTTELVTAKNGLNNAKRAGYFVSHSPIRGIVELTSNSAFSDRITAKDVLSEREEVQIALMSLAMLTKDHQIGAPVYLTAFWSPRESRWKAFECWANTFDFKSKEQVYPGVYF